MLSAMPIPGTSASRIAKDNDGQPVLLFALAADARALSIMSYRLKYLELAHNVKCTIIESQRVNDGIFTLIKFTSKVRHMQEYFFHYAESLVEIIEANPTAAQFAESIKALVEIFSSLGQSPIETVQGLWAELFVINNCKDPALLLDFWHARPEEKFDFSSGYELLEIKCNSSLERAHYFSSEQLNPPTGAQGLIASLFVRQSPSGWTVQHLINSISIRLNSNFVLISKLNFITASALGNGLEESIGIKFDNQTAMDSLHFYRIDDIPKIVEGHIPNGVTEVRYKSSLKALKSVDISALPKKGKLFSAI